MSGIFSTLQLLVYLRCQFHLPTNRFQADYIFMTEIRNQSRTPGRPGLKHPTAPIISNLF